MVVPKIGKKAVALHKRLRGKLEIHSKLDACSKSGLSLAYTPGVAYVAAEIAKDFNKVYEMTIKWNSVAVVSDGTRVLGLGNIGPYAALPVMEGKALLFKAYANIDAFPICLACSSSQEIIAATKSIAPSFGGINLEDIESPKCFEVERRLQQELDIPVFHDDQHGTAVVVLAGLKNSLKLVGKDKKGAKVVVAGAGAAGYAIARLLQKDGFRNIIVCDRSGILYPKEGLPAHKQELALLNKEGVQGSLFDALDGADVFVGVSAPNILKAKHIKKMADSPIVFALSNPIPEISSNEAKKGGCAVFGTARADLPNQINNVLGFPGIFRGSLMVRARKITDEMKLAASEAIANVVGEEISKSKVVPAAFDKRVVPAVAKQVALAAISCGVARLNKSRGEIRNDLINLGLI
ncbi:MAG: NADP-dependent malic enzyme [Candidatus Anstonellaceae archaeon]